MNYTEKENIINNLIQKKEYKKATKALAYLIQLTNREILKIKFNRNVDSNLYNTMEMYRMLDSELYQLMININYIYEEISNNKELKESFVFELREKYKELKQYAIMS